MNTKIFPLITFLIAITSIKAQEVQWLNPQPFGEIVYDIDLVDSLHGVAAGAKGSLAWTNDGGKLWTSVASGTERPLAEIIWLNTQEVIVRFDTGLLYSPDQGQSWSLRWHSPQYYVLRVAFPTPTTGYALLKDMASGAIYRARTTDGGQSWSVFPQPGPWADLTFRNADTGIYLANASDYYRVYRTTDGGTSLTLIWERPQGSNYALRRCAWGNEDTLFMIGKNKLDRTLILRSVDNGASWTPVHEGEYATLKILKVRNKHHVYVGGSHLALISHNSGSTWQKAKLNFRAGSEDYISTMAADNEDLKYVYFIVGEPYDANYNSLLIYKPQTKTVEPDTAHYPYFDVYNLDINANKILVGTNNFLYLSEDDGKTWKKSLFFEVPGSHPCICYKWAYFTELKFLSVNEAIAVARIYRETSLGPDEVFSYIFHTADGGKHWQLGADTTLPACLSLSFPSSDRVYFFGRYALIIQKKDFYPASEIQFYGKARFFVSEDQGNRWIELPLPLDTMANMEFLHRDEGYIFGGGGTTPSAGFYKTLDGGHTWTHTPLGLPMVKKGQLIDAHLMYFLTADSSQVYRAMYDGYQWDTLKVFTCPAGKFIRDIGFTDENTGYVICLEQYNIETSWIYFTQDAGQTWNLTGNFPYLNSLKTTYNQNGFAYGMLGRILQLEKGYPVGTIPTWYSRGKENSQVFPNPSTDFLNIQIPERSWVGTTQITLHNMAGQKVYETQQPGHRFLIPMSMLAPGWYFLTLTNGEGTWHHKVLKK